MHETTTKAVRQRQLSFFLLANKNNTPLFPWRESQNSVAMMAKYTSTVTLRDWRPPAARSQVRGRLSTDGPGTAGVPAAQHRPAPTLKHCQAGSTLEGKSLGVKRGSTTGRETAAARCHGFSNKEGGLEKRPGAAGAPSGLLSPFSNVQNSCHLSPVFSCHVPIRQHAHDKNKMDRAQ